jgi:transcription factor 1
MLSHLAPGASTLLAMLEDASLHEGRQPVDISKAIREMEVKDWAALVRAFHTWPFAPDVSFGCNLFTLLSADSLL